MKRSLSDSAIILTLLMLIVAVGILAFFGRRLDQNFPLLLPIIKWSYYLLLVSGLFYLLFSTTKKNLSFYLTVIFLITLFLLIKLLLVGLEIEIIHLAKYSLLSFILFFCAVNYLNKFSINLIFIVVFIAVGLIGTAEECLQILTPDRVFDLRDIALNVSSAFFGASFARLIR